MLRPLVLTGFEPFGEHRQNPSAELVHRLSRANPKLAAEVLPTSYARAGQRLEQLIAERMPSAVVMLGLASSARALRLERWAHNRDGAAMADNDGQQRQALPIVAGGPARYPSTLPLERFAVAVRQRGCPVVFSDNAGSFVCNHVFYRAAHQVAQLSPEIPCGFVHVPPVHEVALGGDLEPWLSALQACLSCLTDHS